MENLLRMWRSTSMKNNIKFTLNNFFWTPKSEDEYVKFTNRYNNQEKGLVILGGTIAMNYILNKINNEFDVYKKEENNDNEK